MAVDIKVDVQPGIERVLARKPVTFSGQMLDMWARAHTGLAIKFETAPAFGDQPKVRSEAGQDQNLLIMPAEPNLGDLLAASKLIDTGPQRESTPLQVFAKNLSDAAILMSRQEEFAGSNFDPVIEGLYSLGQSLSGSISLEEPAMPLDRRQIQQLPVELPRGAHPRNYENGLFLFLLGKNVILSNPRDDRPLQATAQHSFYSALYSRWRARQLVNRTPGALSHDETEFMREFDDTLISNKYRILRALKPFVADSLGGGRGARAIEELVEQAIEGHLEKKIAQHGRDNVEAVLKGHQHVEDMIFPVSSEARAVFLQDLLPDLRNLDDKYLRGEISREDLESFRTQLFNLAFGNLPVFRTTELMLVRRLAKGSMSMDDKIHFLWNIVQGYDYANAGTPQKAVETGEFECNIRASVLGQMIEKFFPDEFVILGDLVRDHSRLIILDKRSLDIGMPRSAYYVDPTRPRYVGEGVDKRREYRNDYAIREVRDQDLLRDIARGYSHNPNNIVLHSTTEGPFAGASREELNHSIGNYRNTTEAAMWCNMGLWYVKDEADKAFCYRKALDLDPVNGQIWRDLADVTKEPREKVAYFRKAIELNPHDAQSWFLLARSFEDRKYPWEFTDIRPAEVIRIWEQFLWVQKHWPNKYDTSHISLANEKIAELREIQQAQTSRRKMFKFQLKGTLESIAKKLKK